MISSIRYTQIHTGIIDARFCCWMFRCRQRHQETENNEPVIVIQGGVIRLWRRGYQRVRRQRMCMRAETGMRRHEARRRKPVEITERSRAQSIN